MKHLYSALLCTVVHPKLFTIMCVCVCVWGGGGGGGGVSPQPPLVCSIHLDDAMAATGQRRQMLILLFFSEILNKCYLGN